MLFRYTSTQMSSQQVVIKLGAYMVCKVVNSFLKKWIDISTMTLILLKAILHRHGSFVTNGGVRKGAKG
jgi:2-succinyl-5-enolpyruvyl-6-hydroxy-3-cyclohexene-1-carboxylate synthase